jgi:holo-[acyl-carrier protein] synthase
MSRVRYLFMENHGYLLGMIESSGVGIDIVEVDRFKKKKYEKNKIFYKKIFVCSEINYCLKFKNSAERFAAKFAIKEAVIKSISEKIHFIDIEIIYKNAKPGIKLRNSLQKKYNFLVSVSHEKDFAVAIVISEKIK